jgi:hypothetical protein
MASSASNKVFAVRASAVLTTSEVAGTSFDINESWGGNVTAQLDLTLGMLTNGIFRFYVSMDGTNFYTLMGTTGAVLTQTLTASSTLAIPLQVGGWKFLRISVQGTGTVTNSLAACAIRYPRRGSQ